MPRKENQCLQNFEEKHFKLWPYKASPFIKEEARNVFKLFDLKQEKKITKERCIKGLQTMANSSFQFELPKASEEIPLEVDENKFVELCGKFLGFASKSL